MAEDGMGRPREVTCEGVLAAFDGVEQPVATARVLAEELDCGKRTVLRRLQELEERGDVERWKVGAQAVVWWPVDEG
jgi:DNA-binding transcriptional MocR family regulator